MKLAWVSPKAERLFSALDQRRRPCRHALHGTGVVFLSTRQRGRGIAGRPRGRRVTCSARGADDPEGEPGEHARRCA
jgi:hypothetical protein